MNNLLLACVATTAAAMIFARQALVLARTRETATRQATLAKTLEGRMEASGHQLDDLKTRLDWQREKSRRLQNEPAPDPAPPSSDRRDSAGGWPTAADYFWLPKQHLGAVNCQFLQGGHLADDTALLLGMDAAERSAIDGAYDRAVRTYRELEKQSMKPAETPEMFSRGEVVASSTFRFPSLALETAVLQEEFDATVRATLGAARADYLLPRFHEHFQNDLDQFGLTGRVVSFTQRRQPNGTIDLFFGIYDETRGTSTNTRVEEPVEEAWPIATYARLLNIPLKTKAP